MKRKRGVIKLWLAIVLVFVGLLAVVGVTVLTLFLMGRFDEEKIDPAQIGFSQEFNSDEYVIYGGTVGKTSNFYVSSDFRMTITTDTEGVTERDVTLSLSGRVQNRNGWISNGVISVPEHVTLNRSFAVRLEHNPATDEVVGGIATITAKSENVMAETINARLFVDVPVSDIDVSVNENEANENGIFDVVVGADFTLNVDFAPSNSEFVFASDVQGSQDPEKKIVFYEVFQNFVSLDYDTGVFTASDQNSAGQYATINAYTFANSYFQRKFLDEHSDVTDAETLTDYAITYLNQNTFACVQKSVRVRVVDVMVKDVQLGGQATLHATVDKFYRLTAHSQYGDGDLSASVMDTSGEEQLQMLTYLGLRLTAKDGSSLADVKMTGGKIVKVNADGTVEFDVSDTSDETASYYVLPNTAPSAYSSYYWEFAASANFAGVLHANLFFQEDGVWKAFFEQSQEKTKDIDFTVSNSEEDPAWRIVDENIQFVIRYTSAGVVERSFVDLAELYTTGTNNVYRTVRHFIYTTSDVDLTRSFVCKPGVQYTIDGVSRTLYELESSTLTITDAVSVPVFVKVATIKTDAEGKIVYDGENKYVLMNVSADKEVEVTAMLNFANMNPSYTFAYTIGENLGELNGNDTGAVFLGTGSAHDGGNGGVLGSYYVPTVALNATNDKANLISFSLQYTTTRENASADLNKIKQAYQDGLLRIVCLSAGVESDIVTLQSLVEDGNFGDGSGIENGMGTEATIHFVGTMNIDTSKFEAVSGFENSKQISMQLQYDDGKTSHSKPINLIPDNNEPGGIQVNTESFFIYLQQPKNVVGAYEEAEIYDAEQTISVTLSSDETSISWSNSPINGLENLISLLTYKIYDQYGREINQDIGNYRIRLTETSSGERNILNFNNSLTELSSFRSTDKATETAMNVFVVNGSDEFIGTDGVTTSQLESRLQSSQIKFNVTSESVSKIKYDADPTQKKAQTLTEDTENLGSVTVKKYVVVADGQDSSKFNIKDLVEIYVGSSDESDAYVATLNMSLRSDQQKTDLMKIVKFYDVSGAAHVDEDGQSDTAAAYNSLEEISAFELLSPLNDEFTLSFLLSGYGKGVDNARGTLLYRVDFQFTFLDNTQISNNFGNYATEGSLTDYLQPSGEQAIYSVFAGVSGANGYDLDKYLPISINPTTDISATYSWFSVFGSNIEALNADRQNPNGLFYDPSELCTLYSENSKVYLEIADVYQYTRLTIVLRYGNTSGKALRYSITLFLNPNVLVKVSDPSVNLSELGDVGFEVYRVTEYVAGTRTAITSTFLSSVSVVNISEGNKFLTIQEGKFVISNLNQNSDEFKLDFTIDSVVYQSFKFLMGQGATAFYVDAVVVDAQENIALSPWQEEENQGAVLTFEIGLGNTDIVSTIFADADIPKLVTFNGQKQVLLLSDRTYALKDGFTVSSVSGSDLRNLSTSIRTDAGTVGKVVVNSDNHLVVLRDIDGLMVYISLDAIVTFTGSDLFVYYDNYDTQTVDLSDLLGLNGMQNSEISQEIYAGQTYDVVHDATEKTEVGYVQTTDTEPRADKTYYTNSAGEYIETNVESEFAEGTTYYERRLFAYFLTEDVEVDSSKTYFTFNEGQNTFAQVVGPNVSDIKTYYEREVAYGFHFSIDTNSFNARMEVESDNDSVVESFENGLLTIRHSASESIVVLRVTVANNSNSNSFTWRYRIKVLPTFTKGEVTYPYENGVELLDRNSPYRTSEGSQANATYTVNLDEELNASNSRFVDGGRTRFTDISGLEGFTSAYTILKVTIDGQEYSAQQCTEHIQVSIQNGNQFVAIVKNTTAQINVTVRKTFALNDVVMVGSELDYVFGFNQSATYVVTIDQKTYNTNTTSEVEFEIDQEKAFNIRVNLRDGTNPAQPFNALITGEELDSSLQEYKFVEAGTVLSATSGAGSITLSEDTYLSGSDNSITIGEVAYTVEQEDIRTNHLTLSASTTEGRTLTISPKTITRNHIFVVHLFTNAKEVMRLVLTVTGSYKYELASELVGGKTYNLVGEKDSFFTSLKDGTTDLDEGYNVQISTASELVKVTQNAGDWKKTTVEFAYLSVTQQIVFEVQISKGGQLSYTFTIPVEVAANMTGAGSDGNINKTIDDGKEKYFSEQNITLSKEDVVGKLAELATTGSNTEFWFEEEDSQSALPVEPKLVYVRTKDSKPDEQKTYYTLEDGTFVSASVSDAFDANTIYYETESVSGTESAQFNAYSFKRGDSMVGVETSHPLKLVYVFKLQEGVFVKLFEVMVTYRYTCLPNVSVSTGYPMPDKEHTSKYEYDLENLSAEYISTKKNSQNTPYVSETFDNFFNSAATFAGKGTNIVLEFKDQESMESALENDCMVVFGKENATVEYALKDFVKDNSEGKGEFAYILPGLTTNLDGYTYKETYHLEAGVKQTEKDGSLFTQNPSLIKGTNTLARVNVKPLFEGATLEYSIGIKQLRNTHLIYGTTTYVAAGGILASDKNVLTLPNMSFGFELTGESNGFVQFEIVINGVVTNYNVVVVAGNSIVVKVNAPNYSQFEQVYAEDLAQCEDTKLFAENRMVTYKFKDGINGTYYINFKNAAGENKGMSISRGTSASSVVDFGESLAGFKYDGVYHDSSLDSGGKVEDSSVFDQTPELTSRVALIYADGTPIVTDANTKLTYEEGGIDKGDLSEFALTSADLDVDKIIQIKIEVENKLVDIDCEYRLKLMLDFMVENNMDGYGLTTGDDGVLNTTVNSVQLNAHGITSYSKLFENFAEAFKISSARTGQPYSAADIQAKGGTIALNEYGFSDLTVLTTGLNGAADTVENRLRIAAGNFHNDLLNGNYTDKQGIVYYTGLVPRAWDENNSKPYDGGDINKINQTSTSNMYNYIVIQTEESNKNEWRIYAQGANNDGNFVMMRLSYSVDLGDFGTAVTHHNILFKVQPNSALTYRSAANGTPYTSTDVVTKEGRTVATNSGAIYNINLADPGFADPKAENKIVLFGPDSTAAVVATMYGDQSSTNQARNFTYTYKTVGTPDPNDAMQYNTWSTFNDWIKGTVDGGENWTQVGEGTTGIYQGVASTTSQATDSTLSVKFFELELGEKNFYIDLVNKFGYQGKFYFSIRSSLNPVISDVSDLVEGDDLYIGTMFRAVSPEATSNYRRYEPFHITDKGQTISWTLDEDLSVAGVQLRMTLANALTNKTAKEASRGQVTFNAGSVLTRDIATGLESGSIEILPSSSDWIGTPNSGGNQQPATITLEKETDFNAVNNSTVEVAISVGTSVPDSGSQQLKKFYVQYTSSSNPFVLKAQYQLGSSDDHPTVGDSKKLVTLAGIPMYGFRNSYNAIDIGQVNVRENEKNPNWEFDYTSYISDITVKRVDYYYNDAWIGCASTSENSITSESVNTDTTATLLTNSEFSFVDKEGNIVQGITNEMNSAEHTESPHFTVPTFNSALFGESDQLRNVTLSVTLTDGKNEAQVRRNVSIKRKLKAAEFETKVADGSAPLQPGGVFLLNDTLELSLDKGEIMSLVVDQNALDIAYVDISNNAAYVKTKDTAADVNKVYYTASTNKNGQTTFSAVLGNTLTEQDDFDKVKANLLEQRRVVTKNGAAGFATNQYVGIHNSFTSIENNLKHNDTFHVYVVRYTDAQGTDLLQKKEGNFIKTPKIIYAGNAISWGSTTEIEVNSGEDSKQKIYIPNGTSIIVRYGNYLDGQINTSPITLHINDYSEIVGSNTKTEELYFLFAESSDKQTYRMRQSFTVTTAYSKIEATRTSEDKSFSLSDFFILGNGEVENGHFASNEYYMVVKGQWMSGGTVYLTYGDREEKDGNINAYQFRFEADGAFVDEFGTLTTTEDFRLVTGLITLRVYMKVSGADGNYENNNSDILIGTLYIRLKDVGMTVSDALTTEGIYTNTEKLIVVPKGYKIGTTARSIDANQNNEIKDLQNLAYTITTGTTINFHDLLDEQYCELLETTALNNKTYHITEADGHTFVRNNLDTYTFNTAGKQTVTLILAGRNGTSTVYIPMKLTFVVYDNSATAVEQREVHIDRSSDSTYSFATAGSDGDTWYELVEGGTNITTSFTATENGIFTVKYLVVTKTNQTKRVDITFYVYNSNERKSKNVLYDNSGSYRLENIVDNKEDGATYKIFKLVNDKMTEVTSETITEIATGETSVTYYVAKYDSTGQVKSFDMVNVTYFVNKETARQFNAYIKQSAEGKLTSTDVTSTIKNSLGLEAGTELQVWMVADGNVLANLSDLDLTGINWLTRTFLVKYTDTTGGESQVRYVTVAMTYYAYKEEYNLSYITLANSGFRLSNLDKLVKEKTNISSNLATVSYFKFDQSQTTADVQVNSETPETYYVRVHLAGENSYYLINVTFGVYLDSINVASVDANGKPSAAVDDVKNAILTELRQRGVLESGSTKVSFSQFIDEENVTLDSTVLLNDEISTAEVLALVEDQTAYHRFVVTVRGHGQDLAVDSISMKYADILPAVQQEMKTQGILFEETTDDVSTWYVVTPDSAVVDGTTYYTLDPENGFEEQTDLKAFVVGTTYYEKANVALYTIENHAISASKDAGASSNATLPFESVETRQEGTVFAYVDVLEAYYKVKATVDFAGRIFNATVLGNDETAVKSAIVEVLKSNNVQAGDQLVTAGDVTIYKVVDNKLSPATTFAYGDDEVLVAVRNVKQYYKINLDIQKVSGTKLEVTVTSLSADRSSVMLAIMQRLEAKEVIAQLGNNPTSGYVYKASQDEEPVSGTTYYTYDAESGVYVRASLTNGFVEEVTYYVQYEISLYSYSEGRLNKLVLGSAINYVEGKAELYVQLGTEEMLYKATVTRVEITNSEAYNLEVKSGEDIFDKVKTDLKSKMQITEGEDVSFFQILSGERCNRKAYGEVTFTEDKKATLYVEANGSCYQYSLTLVTEG